MLKGLGRLCLQQELQLRHQVQVKRLRLHLLPPLQTPRFGALVSCARESDTRRLKATFEMMQGSN